MAVAGEAADGSEVSRKAGELRPDVVLMDLSMPGPRSGDVIRQVLRACPQTRVLILTMHDDPAYLASAMTAGASGYVVKKVADSELLHGIRAVHAGRSFVDVTHPSGPPPPAFSRAGGGSERCSGCWRRATPISRPRIRSA
jgi:DNA-binding NarL/FixJ family response regulator